MFSTFFEGKHIQENIGSFDEEFHSEVNGIYTALKDGVQADL